MLPQSSGTPKYVQIITRGLLLIFTFWVWLGGKKEKLPAALPSLVNLCLPEHYPTQFGGRINLTTYMYHYGVLYFVYFFIRSDKSWFY
jgi:hypothetical protein